MLHRTKTDREKHVSSAEMRLGVLCFFDHVLFTLSCGKADQHTPQLNAEPNSPSQFKGR